MSKRQIAFLAVMATLALAIPACGGGSAGSSSVQGLLIQSTSIPPAESGGLVNYVIDIEGGCGGPYDVQLLSGALPPGVAIIDKDTWDDDRYEGEGFTQFEHRLFGSPLEDGTYTFDLQLVDTGCTPFASATASYLMRVSVGQVCVVTVEQDGNPALIPTGQTPYNPDHPALPKVVYNDFTSLQFIIAGGVGPYSLKIWDDPNIPNDGNLPLGVSIAATSIVGSPVEVGPDGGPFLCSFEITDSVGETTYFTAYWKIDTPVIIVATESIADGQAGMPYSDTFIVAGGVPPFDFEFVEVGMPEDYTSDANPNPSNPDADVLYNPGEAPTVNPPEALNKIDASSYPAQTDQGPDYAQSNQGIPSEGIYVIETSGSFSGIPRRRGTYSVNMHVKSGLVPNSFGQHAWATYGFEILAAGPVAQDPSYTLEPAFAANPPYAQIQGADQGESYNPDGGVDGLQLLANGGVPQDGRTDAPHYSQTDDANDETYGAYTWEVDWDPDDEGNDVVPAMELTPDGRFKIQDGQEDDLVPMMDRALGFNAIDYALPVQLATTKAEKVRFGIGPDRAIVLESTTSFQPASSSYDNRPHNDTAMAMKVLTSRASGADSMDAISSDHLVGTGDGKIDLPEDAGDITPAALFTGLDITRISINPTGWWDDTYHLNPKAARPFQHGDRNSPYAYYGLGGNGSTYSGSASSYYNGKYMYQPTATCVRLPSAPSVKADRKTGVYNDGGKFYIFETKTHIGVFVIRPDTGIYVPAAYDKDDTGWVSFGDNWTRAYQSNVNSGVKIPQMTVSPDGRVAALKLRTDTKYSRLEAASSTAILLISLTGERMFDGEVSKVIETGSNGTSAQGQYQFASSLTLTNDYLYYMIGSGSTTYLSWKDHYIYRYELDSGDDAGALLHSKFNSEWTNTSGSAMQMPFQNFYYDFEWSSSVPNPHPRMYSETGYNCHEVPTAPHPFRVNADGNACAILAGKTTTSTSGSTVLKHHVWVDYEGELTQLSETLRRTSGGGAGTQLWGGPMYSPCAYQWASFNGPTTRFEISDDGQKVAVSYKRNTTSNGFTSYSTGRYHYREDIAAFVTTDEWSSHKIHEITGDSSTSVSPNGKFRTSTVWRFGALTFTADGGGLIFWGGRSNYGPTTTYSSDYYMYYGAKSYVGSLYSYDFSDSSVRNILGSKEGGAKDTVGSALTSINYSTSAWQVDGGAVKPFGGFISSNRNFLYISNKGALTSSDQRDGMLVGVNIRSLNTSNSINGHTDGRAFVVDGFATLQSWIDGGYSYHYLGGLGYYYNYSGYNWYYAGNYGDTLKGAATDNGWVYFTSTKASGYAYAARSNLYGGAVNATYYTYPYYGKSLYVFDPNVGGDVQEIAPSTFGGQGTYGMVGHVEVSDDGSTMGCTFCSSAYYNYSDKEKLFVWTNVELDASGDLDYDKLTENQVESSQGYVGSHFAFGPNNVDVYYAQGTGNENQQELKKATIDGGSPSAFSFPKKNYNVLHAGR